MVPSICQTVTTQKSHYLWVLRFSWWQNFRFWSSVMWCCITGWGNPAGNMFIQHTGSLGSPNVMAAHPRRPEYLRNIIFMYKLSAHYWCNSTWIFTSYVPWCRINWPKPPLHPADISTPPPSRYINSKYYLAANMSIRTQFWKEALSAFRGEVPLHDTLIYWCNYHISTFSNAKKRGGGGGTDLYGAFHSAHWYQP